MSKTAFLKMKKREEFLHYKEWGTTLKVRAKAKANKLKAKTRQYRSLT